MYALTVTVARMWSIIHLSNWVPDLLRSLTSESATVMPTCPRVMQGSCLSFHIDDPRCILRWQGHTCRMLIKSPPSLC